MPACTSLVKVNIAFQPLEDGPSSSSSSSSVGHEVLVSASASATGQTGVEMEALVAATFAAINLTLASSASGNNTWGAAAGASLTEGAARGGGVLEVLLESKTGGKSGDYVYLGPTCGPEDPPSTAASAGDSGTFAGTRGGFAGGAPASASASLRMPLATWRQLAENVNKKGDVLGVSRLAGIMAADMARELLPAGGRGGRRSDGFEVCSGTSDAPCLVT